MKTPLSRYAVPALLAAAIPAGFALAQAPSQPQPQAEPQQKGERPRLSEDALQRLQSGRVEGRIAEIKETLKLNDAQAKLFAPVEQQLRASSAARQKARAEWRERREAQGARPSLVERLDRANQRMTERAQRMQAFTTAFKPFYESLNEEQRAVAGIVLRDMRGGMRGPGRRWAMEHWREHGPRGGGREGEREQSR